MFLSSEINDSLVAKIYKSRSLKLLTVFEAWALHERMLTILPKVKNVWFGGENLGQRRPYSGVSLVVLVYSSVVGSPVKR